MSSPDYIVAEILKDYKSLKFLPLHRMSFTDASITRLIEILSSKDEEIHHIDIRGSKVSEKGAAALCDLVRAKKTIHTLELGSVYTIRGDAKCLNTIGDAGLRSFFPILGAGCTLTKLDVSENNITDGGVIELCSVLATNYTLVVLNLSLNPITDKGGVQIAKMMRRNPTLVSLYLSYTKIGNPTALEFAVVLRENSTLQHLDLSLASIADSAAMELLTAIESNYTIQALSLGGGLTGSRMISSFKSLFSKRKMEQEELEEKIKSRKLELEEMGKMQVQMAELEKTVNESKKEKKALIVFHDAEVRLLQKNESEMRSRVEQAHADREKLVKQHEAALCSKDAELLERQKIIEEMRKKQNEMEIEMKEQKSVIERLRESHHPWIPSDVESLIPESEFTKWKQEHENATTLIEENKRLQAMMIDQVPWIEAGSLRCLRGSLSPVLGKSIGDLQCVCEEHGIGLLRPLFTSDPRVMIPWMTHQDHPCIHQVLGMVFNLYAARDFSAMLDEKVFIASLPQSGGMDAASCMGIVAQNMSFGTLHSLLGIRELQLVEFVMISLDICAGIAHLHSHGIVHGCIQNDRIMIDRNAKGDVHAYVSHIGLYDDGSNDALKDDRLRWIAPELIVSEEEEERDKKEETVAIGKKQQLRTMEGDIWSLGIVMLSMMTRRLPFADALDIATIRKRISCGVVDDIPEFHQQQLPDMVELVRICLSMDPKERPSAKTTLFYAKRMASRFIPSV